MGQSDRPPYDAHLRSIRSALAALALAVLAAPLLMADEHYGFALFLIVIVLVLYSFVPTLLQS